MPCEDIVSGGLHAGINTVPIGPENTPGVTEEYYYVFVYIDCYLGINSQSRQQERIRRKQQKNKINKEKKKEKTHPGFESRVWPTCFGLLIIIIC